MIITDTEIRVDVRIQCYMYGNTGLTNLMLHMTHNTAHSPQPSIRPFSASISPTSTRSQLIGIVPSTHSAKWHSQCQVPIREGDRHKTLFRTKVFGTGSAKYHLALPVPIAELTGISGDSGSRRTFAGSSSAVSSSGKAPSEAGCRVHRPQRRL
mgnify:CR=1 FL=1